VQRPGSEVDEVVRLTKLPESPHLMTLMWRSSSTRRQAPTRSGLDEPGDPPVTGSWLVLETLTCNRPREKNRNRAPDGSSLKFIPVRAMIVCRLLW